MFLVKMRIWSSCKDYPFSSATPKKRTKCTFCVSNITITKIVQLHTLTETWTMLLGSLYCNILTDKFLPLGVSGRRGIVVACVCPSVCLSIRELYLACTITYHIFKLESLHLYQGCFLWYSQLVLKIRVIDRDLQGHFSNFVLELLEIRLVRGINLHRFGMESPNLHQTCILGYPCLVWKIGVIDLDL